MTIEIQEGDPIPKTRTSHKVEMAAPVPIPTNSSNIRGGIYVLFLLGCALVFGAFKYSVRYLGLMF
jgi:hypothetical protein